VARTLADFSNLESSQAVRTVPDIYAGKSVLRDSLTSGQRLLLEIIESLRFGRLERVTVHLGIPAFEPAPQVFEDVKLGSELDACHQASTGATLARDFEHLFRVLNQVGDGVVNIEIRNNRPFRVTFARRHCNQPVCWSP
jgi:hypothetical protein